MIIHGYSEDKYVELINIYTFNNLKLKNYDAPLYLRRTTKSKNDLFRGIQFRETTDNRYIRNFRPTFRLVFVVDFCIFALWKNN